MRLFLVSVLAVLGTAYGAAVNYQYRNQLLSYSPSRGEFPVQAGVSQAFVRYIDAQGTQHLIPYQYQEPLFAVRRLSHSENDKPNVLLRSGFSQSSSQEQQQQEMEASFRAWCEQRYNELRSQIDELRAQGMKPSLEMIEQLKPLENMLKTTDVNYESPEMQIAREEQLRLWNEARQQVEAEEQRLRAKQMELIQQAQQTQQAQQSQDTQQAGPSAFQTKTSIPQTEMPVEETAEQKRAREEHLRIYNEQLQQIEAQRLRSQAAESNKATIRENAATQTKTSWQGTENAQQIAGSQTAETNKASFQSNAATQTKTYWQGAETTQQTDATPEVVRATQEHLRIWNEAKLRAEKQGETTQTNQGLYQQNEWTDAQPMQPEIGQRSDFNPAQFVKDTPEVVRAREEHLRLVNEAKLRAESTSTNNAYDDGSYKQETTQSAKETAFFKYNPSVQPTNMAATETKTVFVNQVADTPEVIRAREEHLRAVNEAKLKAQASEQYKQESTQQFEQKQNQGFWKTTEYTQTPVISNEQIMDTPEVIRAREEHLRIFNEAQRQAEKQQQIESSKLQQSSFSEQGFKAYQSTENKSDYAFSTEQERMLEAERLREAERLAAEERMREERLLEAERQREAERIALEAKLREEEMQREMLRLKEEERFQEIERMRHAREEAERLEMERIEEAKRLTTANTQESVTSQASTQKQSSEHFGQTKTVIPTTVQFAAVVPGVQQTIPASYILKNQYQNNPFLLRTVQQSNTPLIAAQKPADFKFKYVDNPFLIHYTEGAQGSALKSGISTSSGSSASFSSASQSSAAASQSSSSFKSDSVQQIGLRSDAQPTKQQATTGTASDSALSSSFKFNYGDSSDIAALEKATREHFRAHEEALEQLRLARLKNPDNKDCN